MLRTSRRAAAVAATVAPLLVVLATPAQAAGPTLSVADLVVTETNGVQTKTLTVKLSAKSVSTVTVKVATANGTATAPADYTAVPLTTLSFAPGVVSKTVAVKVAGDVLDEADETFKVVLSSPVRATIARGTALVTVKDEDAAPGLTVTGTTLAEGSGGLAAKSVNLTLNAVSGRPVTVAWETVAGTATSGVDYEPADGTVTIPAGATSAPVPLSVDGDTADEPDERFYVRLASVLHATPSAAYHRVVLTDDDLPRTPVLDPLVPASGAAATVSLAGAADGDATVRVYAAAACVGAPVVTAAASRLGSGGVTAPVSPNALNTYSADTLSPRGETSACSNAVTYAHATPPPPPPPAPAAPVLDEFVPATGSATTVALYGTAPSDTVLRVFSTADCAGKQYVTSASSRLGGGLPVTVEPDAETTFSAQAVSTAGGESECSNSVTYTHVTPEPPVPATPVLDTIVPAVGQAPYTTLFGSAPSDATVVVYGQEACASEPVYTTTGSRLGTGGVTVPAAENVATAYSVRAVSPEGVPSGCSNAVTYTHDSVAPEPPVLAVPAGPANDNTPMVKGAAEADAKVLLYAGAACAGDVLATGTAAAFAATGLAMTVADDTSSYFSARARDRAGNVSRCGTGGPYVEDSTAPVATVTSFPSEGVGSVKVAGEVEDAGTVTVVTASPDQAHTCGTALLTGVTRTQFAAGVVVRMPLKDLTWVRVLATDAAGNTTACADAPAHWFSDLTSENEPANDAAGTADNGATYPNDVVEHYGEVGQVNDRDYYRVYINETGTTFSSETSNPPNAVTTCLSNKLDTKLFLYDAAGALIASDDDAGQGFCSRLVRTNLAPGVYHLVVSHTSFTASLPFPFAYKVAMGYTTPQQFSESEPNNDIAAASQLGAFNGLGVDGEGSVWPSTDVDYWVVTLSTTRTYVFEVFDTGDGACAANQLDSRLTLYNGGGGQVVAPDDDSGGGLCSKITTTLTAGQYYIAVQRSPNAAADHTFSYRVGVR